MGDMRKEVSVFFGCDVVGSRYQYVVVFLDIHVDQICLLLLGSDATTHQIAGFLLSKCDTFRSNVAGSVVVGLQ